MTDTAKIHGLTLRIDTECKAQLKAIAENIGTPQSEVVRTLIRTAYTNLLKNQRKPDVDIETPTRSRIRKFTAVNGDTLQRPPG